MHLTMKDHTTQFVTLSEAKEDDLWSAGSVLYERLEAAFNHEQVVFTRMSNTQPPVTFTLTVDELDEFFAAYTGYRTGDQSPPSPLHSSPVSL